MAKQLAQQEEKDLLATMSQADRSVHQAAKLKIYCLSRFRATDCTTYKCDK